MTSEPRIPESFIRELTVSQNAIHAFIYSLLPDPEFAMDVLQETNIQLWNDAHQYVDGTNFLAWACAIARFKVLENRRKTRRDRLIFDDQFVSCLAPEFAEDLFDADRAPRLKALEDCMAELTERQRQLVRKRYHSGMSVAALAEIESMSPRGLSVSLHRIRKSLMLCIEKRLGGGRGQ